MTLDQAAAVVVTAAPDVLERILAQADQTPAEPAIKDSSRSLTYEQLRAEAAALASGLRARGVGPGDRVAICIPNSIDSMVAALACMWTGAIFIPLPTADPAARIAAILGDCQPAVVLTNDATAELTPAWPQPTVHLDEVAQTAETAASPVPATGLAAYAIYTSGTTGTPKGVVIGRAAFATAVRSSIEALGLDARTRSMCVSPFHFDGAFATLFTTLAVGGSLILPGQESIPYARYFFRTVAREGITYTGFSPTYLRLILASPLLAGLAETPLRAIALGGEACSAHDVAALHAAAPEVRVFNRYGPTETTIVCTHFDVTGSGEDYRDRAVPIGVPHPGVTFHLVDENGQLIDEIDRPGELYIGGAQLMDGYWGAAELTAQVMRTDIVPGRTVYRSGDLVRRDASGNYVYIDRLDHVVIRNANRISMVELAQAFRGLPGVTAATCASFDDEGRLGLATFVVTTGHLTSTDVHLAAISQVPERMMPNVIKVVDAFPHTSSNKVDTRALLLQADLRPM